MFINTRYSINIPELSATILVLQYRLDTTVAEIRHSIDILGGKAVRRTNCEMTKDFVNAYDKGLEYTCPDNKVLAGVSSVHNNVKEDRRWKFKCCDIDFIGGR